MSEAVSPFYWGDKKRAVANAVFSDNFSFGMFLLFGIGGFIGLIAGVLLGIFAAAPFFWLLLMPGIGVTYFSAANAVWGLNGSAERGYDSVMKMYHELPEETRKELKPIAIDYADPKFNGNDAHFKKLVSGHNQLIVKKKTERNKELINELFENLESRQEDAKLIEDAQKEAEAARQKAREEIAEINRKTLASIKEKNS